MCMEATRLSQQSIFTKVLKFEPFMFWTMLLFQKTAQLLSPMTYIEKVSTPRPCSLTEYLLPVLTAPCIFRCGTFVTKVAEGSSFDRAQLRASDQLIQFNDTKLDQFSEDRITKMLTQST